MKAIFVASVLGVVGAASAQETMYGIDGNIMPFLVEIDKTDGQLLDITLITGAEALFGGLAIDDAGDLYSIDGFNDGDSDRLFLIDAETAAGEVVGETGFNWNFRNLTVHPQTDVLYGTRDNQLYTLDRDTGAATLITNISGPTLDQLTTMAIDSNGNAYGTDIGDTGLFLIDLTTGAATHVGNVGQSGNWFNDLAFDENDVLYGGRFQGGVYTIDVATAVQTLAFQGNFTGLAFFSEGGDECLADCNGDGSLSILDFVCFQQFFQAGDEAADCNGDGSFSILDFVCYQQIFQDGCD